MWYEERVKGASNNGINKFSICCQKGKVKLPLLQPPPPYLKQLLETEGSDLRTFKEQSRMLNSLFALTSMGGKVDNKINEGNAPYVFRLNGQNHHKIGSLLPPVGEEPKFTQLYIHDTENEVQNRLNILGDNKKNKILIQRLLKIYQKCLTNTMS